jgi:hypothetical protein
LALDKTIHGNLLPYLNLEKEGNTVDYHVIFTKLAPGAIVIKIPQ